nr:hypothetical protein [Tanacetum cinerariifolium]
KNESDDVNDEDEDNDDNGDDDNSDNNDNGGNDDGGNEDDYEENPLFTLADYDKEEQDKELKVYCKALPSHLIFTSKLLNLDDPSPDINSLMNTSTVPPPPPLVYPSSHPTTIPQQQTPDSTTTITNPTMTLLEIPNFAGRDDQEKDKDPSAGSDRGTKRRNSSKDDEPSKGSKSKELNLSSSSKGTQSQHKSSGKSTQAEEPEFNAADTKMHQDQGIETGHIDDQPDNEATPNHDWFQKPD